MMEFVTLIAAIVIANLIAGTIALAVILNKRFIKWYMEYCLKLTNEITESWCEED